jgi:hypothetical protein
MPAEMHVHERETANAETLTRACKSTAMIRGGVMGLTGAADTPKIE